MKQIRLLIAEDHEITRVGLAVFFENARDIAIIGEARNGHEAIEMAIRLSPDIILLNYDLPGLNGIQVAAELKKRGSPVRILFMSAQETRNYVFAMLKTGSSGFLSKQDLPDDYIRAVREVAAGKEEWLSQRMEEKMASWKRSPLHTAVTPPLKEPVRSPGIYTNRMDGRNEHTKDPG